MKKHNFLFLATVSLLGLGACNISNGGKESAEQIPSSQEEVIDTSNMVPVFVLAGQSNMQGNTRISNG
ncbi:MAG: hypothetical protein J6328_02420, partial [Bacilli bacterium]|nr:hypothetical protein [Bacilli bacterium]